VYRKHPVCAYFEVLIFILKKAARGLRKQGVCGTLSNLKSKKKQH